MITANEIKAKYWALEVISSHNQNDMSNISGTLGTSKIDLNPHQIEAALFALKSQCQGINSKSGGLELKGSLDFL